MNISDLVKIKQAIVDNLQISNSNLWQIRYRQQQCYIIHNLDEEMRILYGRTDISTPAFTMW